MPRLFSAAVAALAASALAVETVAPAFAAPGLTRADYEACHAADEDAFRRSLEAISLKALEDGTKGVDYGAAVADAWRRQGVDAILDKQVDAAIEEVRSETSWSGLAQSLISKEKAQELATDVAERTYRSQAIKSAIEGLATAVGTEVGRAIELAIQDAAGPALECLRAFLGPRYGMTVAGVVTAEAERDFGLSTAGGAEVNAGAVLRQSGEGLTGAAILLVRRQLANMAARIGQRLAGSVLSRLVSVAAGGVGLVLIAKDLWDFRNGALPIIAEEMKSAAAKDNVKAELAKTIAEQITLHLAEIAAKSAERIVAIWQEFRQAHMKALDLAGRNAAFRAFLDTVKPEALGRLDEVVALVLAADGEAGVLARLDDGRLNEAVRFLPEPAMAIARQTRSIDAALRWSELAGDRLAKVLEYEVYRRASPDGFTKATLAALLALDDPIAVPRLAALDADARARLFELPAGQLKTLARGLSDAELATLAGYLAGLGPEARLRLLDAVASQPARMRALNSARVRNAVVSSADQPAAVEMMLRDGGLSVEAAVTDVRAAWDGRVAPLLVAEKHPLLLVLAGLLALVALLMLRRLLFTPRARPA